MWILLASAGLGHAHAALARSFLQPAAYAYARGGRRRGREGRAQRRRAAGGDAGASKVRAPRAECDVTRSLVPVLSLGLGTERIRLRRLLCNT
jgi:hypothetical protein